MTQKADLTVNEIAESFNLVLQELIKRTPRGDVEVQVLMNACGLLIDEYLVMVPVGQRVMLIDAFVKKLNDRVLSRAGVFSPKLTQ